MTLCVVIPISYIIFIVIKDDGRDSDSGKGDKIRHEEILKAPGIDKSDQVWREGESCKKKKHNDAMIWERFAHYLLLVRGIHKG